MSKLKIQNSNSGNAGFLKKLTTERRFRFGGFALLTTAIVLVVAILLNVVLGMIEDNWALSIDLSPTRVTNFDDSTKEVLKGVDQDIVIHLLYQESTDAELKVQLDEMCKKYHALNNHITFDYIDPYTEPAKVAKYLDTNTVQISEGTVIVTKADDSKSRYILRSDLYNYSYVADNTSSWGYSYQQAFNGEAKITSAIKYVNEQDTPNIYFLSGHNELGPDYVTMFTKYLKQENYNCETITLADKDLEQGDTVVIVDPQVDLTDGEFEEMVAFLENGGRLLMTLDNLVDTATLPNFCSMLDIYSLSFGDGYVVEDSNNTSRWINTPSLVLPVVDAENDITKTIAENKLALIVPGGRPINECDMPLSGVQYAKLLTSSDRSYVADDLGSEDPQRLAEGSQVLAYTAYKNRSVYDPDQDTRIALLSSAYMFADTNILTQCYNLDFSMAVVEWLVNHDVSVYVRASQIINTTLAIPDAATAYTIAAVVIGVIPLAVAAAGIVVWLRRRHL